MSEPNTYLSTKGITHDYGGGKGAIDISFDVRPGEIVGFIGPNGAGKTTTMRMIMGFIKLQAGSISMFGNPINSEADLLVAQNNVGYLPADNLYYSGYSTEKLLKYANKLYGKDVGTKGAEIAKELDLDTKSEIKKLSSGNQRKVGVVASIVHDPKLVILDEPTTGLDPLIQQKVLSQLEKVKANGGSVFLSSHLLSEVEQICDRIIMIKDAKIILADSTVNILQKAHRKFRIPDYSEILNSEIEKVKNGANIRMLGDEAVIYVKDPKPILQILMKHDISEFYLEKPSLEEMFLNEYQ